MARGRRHLPLGSQAHVARWELGPVPVDPAARQAWQTKAAWIAAYRETYSYDHSGDPIGPEPSRQRPDQQARLAPGLRRPRPARQPGVRAMPDRQLWLPRDTGLMARRLGEGRVPTFRFSTVAVCLFG